MYEKFRYYLHGTESLRS